jgi:hypothetical protein
MARKKPLHDPMKTRSPATAGVEKTQPPASNVQETTGRSAMGRRVTALVVAGGGAQLVEMTANSRLRRLRRYPRMTRRVVGRMYVASVTIVQLCDRCRRAPVQIFLRSNREMKSAESGLSAL